MSTYTRAKRHTAQQTPWNDESRTLPFILGWVITGILVTACLMVWDYNQLEVADFNGGTDTGVGCIDDCLEPAQE